MKFNQFLLPLITLALIACTGGSSDPIKKHQQALSEPPNSAGRSENDSSKNNPEDLKPANENELKIINSWTQKKYFSDRETVFLDDNNWQNPQITLTKEFIHFVDSMQKEALFLLENKKQINIPLWKKFYSSQTQNLEDQGQFRLILKKSPYSTPLILKISKEFSQAEISTKMSLLFLAYETQNSHLSEELAREILENSQSINNFLSKTQQDDLKSKFNLLLTTLINQIQSGSLKIETTFLAKNFNLLDSNEDKNIFVAGEVLSSKKMDAQSLTQKNYDEQIRSLADSPFGYMSKIKWIESTAPQFLTQLKIEKMSLGLEFFVIEQVMQRKWTFRQAVEFAKGAKLKPESINKKAKDYAALIISYTSAVIQSDLNNFFKTSDKVEKNQLFNLALASIEPRFTEARFIIDQLKTLMTFTENFSKTDRSEIRSIVDSMAETFRLTVTDPITLALLNKGILLNIDPFEKLVINGYPLSKINTFNDYFIEAFNGLLDPLIQIVPLNINKPNSPSEGSKNRYSNNEALEFALRTQYFGPETSSGDEALLRILNHFSQLNVNAPTKRVDPSTIVTPTTSIEKAIDELQSREANGDYKLAMQLCSINSLNKFTNRIDITSLAWSPLLGSSILNFKSNKNSSSGSSIGSTNITRKQMRLFPVIMDHFDALEIGRSDFLIRIAEFEKIVFSVEKDTPLRFPLFKKRVSEIRNSYKTLFDTLSSQMREYLPCWLKLFDYQRYITSQILIYEKSYWEWAVKPENRAKSADLFKVSPESSQFYRTHFENDRLLSYDFDFLIRVRHYMLVGLPHLQLAPLTPLMQIQLTQAISKEKAYKEAKLQSISLDQDLQKSIFQIVRSLNLNDRESSVQWFQSSVYHYTAAFSENIPKGAISLLRFSQLTQDALVNSNKISLDETLTFNQLPFHFLSLTENEKTVFPWIGQTEIFNGQRLSEIGILFDDQGQTKGLNDLFIANMTQPFSANFSNAAINPAPMSFVDLRQATEKLRAFKIDRKSVGAHVFKDLIKSSDLISDFIKRSSTNEVELLDQTYKSLLELNIQRPQQTLQYSTSEATNISTLNPFRLEDLKNRVIDFKKSLTQFNE